MLIIPPLFNNNVQKQTETGTVGNGFTKEGTLEIINAENKTFTIDIEFAKTPDEQALGLMFREQMDANQGMLFIFPDNDYRSFWMKNTHISLDMLFITDSLEIATIHKNTIPFAEKSYPSSRPVKYVLELVAGYCEQNNIKTGDKIRYF